MIKVCPDDPIDHPYQWPQRLTENVAVQDLLRDGLNFFHAGRFFDAHEAWEELWNETPPGPLRLFYQGLIQGAVGLHHFSRGNLEGARSQLTKALAKLESSGFEQAPIDPSAVVDKLRKTLEILHTSLHRSHGLQ
jgi:hypothetical protein